MNRKIPACAILILALPLVGLLSLAVGSASIPLPDLLSGLFCRVGFETESTILYAIRLPRLLASLIAGVGLSLSGVLLQAVIGNPLASPNTIGVNGGAGLCVVLCLALLPDLTAFLPLAAFLGAFGTVLLILAIAKGVGHGGSHTVILAGIGCTTLFSAAISFFNVLNDDILITYNAFSVGSFSGVSLSTLPLPAILIALCLITALSQSKHIAALSLGDELASSLGVHVKRARGLCLVLASISAASVVSFAGLLGFVGLVVPHIARRLFGTSIQAQLTAAPLLGALTVTLSDLAARVLFRPAEIPVGIVMAFIGAPFFLYLLLRPRKEERL